MVYRYKCRECGMISRVNMTEEQHERLTKAPRLVYDLLPQLQGVYKTMIRRGTCPHCYSEGAVRPE